MYPQQHLSARQNSNRSRLLQEYEPYKISLSKLSPRELEESIERLSPKLAELASSTIIPALTYGEFPERRETERLLSRLGISDLIADRRYRFVSGYCALTTSEFQVGGDWPLSIEETQGMHDRYNLTVDIPTDVTTTSRQSTMSSLLSTRGNSWERADQLAATLGLPGISSSCADRELTRHQNEVRVSIQLSGGIEVHLYSAEVCDSRLIMPLFFPAHVPVEITHASSESWKQNQFARNVDEHTGGILITSHLLQQGRESLRANYQPSDESLQEIAKSIRRQTTADIELTLRRHYSNTNTSTDGSPFEELSLLREVRPCHASAGISLGDLYFRFSDSPDISPLDLVPTLNNEGGADHFLTACLFPPNKLAKFALEMSRSTLAEHGWEAATRIVRKCAGLYSRSLLESEMLSQRNKLGFPSTVSPNFQMLIDEGLLMKVATSI